MKLSFVFYEVRKCNIIIDTCIFPPGFRAERDQAAGEHVTHRARQGLPSATRGRQEQPGHAAPLLSVTVSSRDSF